MKTVPMLASTMKTHQLQLKPKLFRRCKMTPLKLQSVLKSKKEWIIWDKKSTKEKDQRKTWICLKTSTQNFRIRVSLNKLLRVQLKLVVWATLHWAQQSLMKVDQMIKWETQMNCITLINLSMIETLIQSRGSVKTGKIIMIKEITTLELPVLQDFNQITSLFQMHGLELLQSINQSTWMAQISNQLMPQLLPEVESLWLTWLLILKSMQLDLSRISSKRVLLLLFRLWMVDLAEVILSLVLHQLKIKEFA